VVDHSITGISTNNPSLQRRDGAQRDAADQRLLQAKMVHAGKQLVGIEVDAVLARIGRLVAAAVTQQV
jgi:hypothetical protein